MRANAVVNALKANRGRVLELAALAGFGLGTTLFVLVTQIRDRAPLAWDEAARGYAGLRLSDALANHSPRAVFEWVNAQTFFPALASAPGGLVLWLGGSVTAAAWLPTLSFFFVSGFAVAFLGRALKLPQGACVAAALLLWTTPVLNKLAAGSFTEPLGMCLQTAVLCGLVALVDRPSVRIALLTGIGIGLATAVKYDYGLLCFATAAVAEGVRAATSRSRQSFIAALVTLGSGAVLSGAQFAFNSTAKIAGASDVISSNSGSAAKRYARAFTSGEAGDFGYYLRLMFEGGELGLSKVVAACMLLGVVVAVYRARHQPRWRVPLVFLALWWTMYSLARAKFARYAATSIPVFSIFGALFLATAVEMCLRKSRRSAIAGVVAVVVVSIGSQIPASATPFGFLAPNPPIERTLAFLRRELRASDRAILYIGPSNELSPQMVQLTWDLATRRRNGGVETVQEVPPEDRESQLQSTLSRLMPDQVLVVSFEPGARIDTLDQRTTFRAQPTFVRIVEGLVQSGSYEVVSQLTVDRGRMHVRVMRPVPNRTPEG